MRSGWTFTVTRNVRSSGPPAAMAPTWATAR